MHIPDGFLSPQTCAAAWAVAVPAWFLSWRQIKSRYHAGTASHLGLAAAFVFLVQMINMPIPGGTTGHATGAALITLALGPAAGILAVSMALLLQALVFGDGGIMAYGANVLSMAVVQSGVAWLLWKLIARPGASALLRTAAGFAAAYGAVVAGGAVTGLMLGLQPVLFKGNDGLPLYFPLGLAVSLPAMIISHLLIGVVEGGITAGAMKILQRLPGFKLAAPLPFAARRKVTVFLAAFALAVPLGIFLPMMFQAGDPWGEWSPEETARVAQQASVPAGMDKYADKYSAPVPDYQFLEAQSVTGETMQYVGSALLGLLLVVALCFPLHHLQQRRLQKLREARK